VSGDVKGRFYWNGELAGTKETEHVTIPDQIIRVSNSAAQKVPDQFT